MKLLHIQKVNGICGSEMHLLQLLPQLAKAGYDVTFLILVEPKKPMTDYHDLFKDSGVTVQSMIIKGDVDPWLLWRLRCFIKMGAFDLVHTHLIHADLYGTFAARLAGAKLIISSKHGYHKFYGQQFVSFMERLVARYQQRIIVISQTLGTFLNQQNRLPKEKMVTIHYGLKQPEAVSLSMKKQRQELGLAEKVPVLATVARLIPIKGHSYLLRAMPRVKQEFPNVVLLLIGDGYLEKELKKETDRLGLQHNVRFLGYRSDVAALLPLIDISLLPSLGEGFGLVLLEAMVAAKPIIASRVAAIPEIVVDKETGLLVTPRDSKQLAAAIIQLLRDKEWANKLGAAGQARYQRLFTETQMVAKTDQLYQQLAGKPGRVGSAHQQGN